MPSTILSPTFLVDNVETDHQLKMIMRKPLNCAPKQLQHVTLVAEIQPRGTL